MYFNVFDTLGLWGAIGCGVGFIGVFRFRCCCLREYFVTFISLCLARWSVGFFGVLLDCVCDRGFVFCVLWIVMLGAVIRVWGGGLITLSWD